MEADEEECQQGFGEGMWDLGGFSLLFSTFFSTPFSHPVFPPSCKEGLCGEVVGPRWSPTGGSWRRIKLSSPASAQDGAANEGGSSSCCCGAALNIRGQKQNCASKRPAVRVTEESHRGKAGWFATPGCVVFFGYGFSGWDFKVWLCSEKKLEEL